MTTPLAALKIHLNVIDDADDAVLEQKLKVATAWVGKIVGGDVTDTDPEPIHEGVRLIAAHLFKNREASLVGVTAQELPFGALDMLEPYRCW